MKIAYVGNDTAVLSALREEIGKLDGVVLVEDMNEADELVYGFNAIHLPTEPPEIAPVEKIRSSGPKYSRRSRKDRW